MKRVLTIAVMIMSISWISGISNQIKAQTVVVIVNNDNPIGDMKQIEAKLYFLKKIKKSWPALGVSISPVRMSGNSSAKQAFLSGILKMTESEVDGYYKQRQFANAEQMPQSFANDEQVIAYVSNNPGAIGYVSQAAFEAAAGKVKAVFAQ